MESREVHRGPQRGPWSVYNLNFNCFGARFQMAFDSKKSLWGSFHHYLACCPYLYHQSPRWGIHFGISEFLLLLLLRGVSSSGFVFLQNRCFSFFFHFGQRGPKGFISFELKYDAFRRPIVTDGENNFFSSTFFVPPSSNLNRLSMLLLLLWFLISGQDERDGISGMLEEHLEGMCEFTAIRLGGCSPSSTLHPSPLWIPTKLNESWRWGSRWVREKKVPTRQDPLEFQGSKKKKH